MKCNSGYEHYCERDRIIALATTSTSHILSVWGLWTWPKDGASDESLSFRPRKRLFQGFLGSRNSRRSWEASDVLSELSPEVSLEALCDGSFTGWCWTSSVAFLWLPFNLVLFALWE